MKKNDLKKQSKTDWARVDAIKDEDIDFSDIPEITDDMFARATFVPSKQLITIRLDTDVVDWLKKSGRGYQTRTNKILRSVMEQTIKPTKKREQRLHK